MTTVTKKEGIQHTEARIGESIKKKWESKGMYGQYVRSMDRQLISTDDTFLWWSKGETGAAQDQVLQTTNHAIKILQKHSKCRLCKKI